MGRKAGVSKYPTPEAKRAAKNEQMRRRRAKLKTENPEEYERRKLVHRTKQKEKRLTDPEFRAAQNASSKRSTAKRKEMLGIVSGPVGRPRKYANAEEKKMATKAREEERKAADPNYKGPTKKSADNRRSNGKTTYTEDHKNVENYDKALKDNFDKNKWLCHHRLESYYRSDTLKALKMYKKVPAEQLIWLPAKKHRSDACSSTSRPLNSIWHKSIFEVIKSTLDLADRSKLPKEFDELVTEVENDEDDALTEENFTKDEISSIMDVYWKMQKIASLYVHYYTAMRLVETGKKKLW